MRPLGLLALLLVAAGCTNRLVDETPRLYACARDAGLNSCPGAWRCGLSGFCQDPAQTLPYACETSDDCSAPWRCGTDRVCYDRTLAVDRACRLGRDTDPSGSDCADGWRCGREENRGNVCHPLGAGAPYLCVADSDCEATWRCGPEGACVDVALQGLRAGDVSVMASKVSPRLPSVMGALQLNITDPSSIAPINSVLFTAADQLNLVTVDETFGTKVITQSSATLARPVHALARTEGNLLVTDSTGLLDYAEALNDAGSPSLISAALADAELRYAPPLTQFGNPLADEELVSFRGGTLGVCGRGPTNLRTCDPTTFQLATLPAGVTVNDVTFLDGSQRRSVLAATSAGPYFAPHLTGFLSLDGGAASAPVWRPVSLAGLSDACGSAPVALDRLRYDSATGVLAATTNQDQSLSLFKDPRTAQRVGACEALTFEREYGPCAVCAAGETLLQFGTDRVSPFDDDIILALCQRAEPDGGRVITSYRHHSDGGCALEPVPLPRSVRHGYHVTTETPGLQGVDSSGIPRGCPDEGCPAMIATISPDRVAGGPDVLAAYKEDQLDSNGSPQPAPSALSGPLGLTTFPSTYVAGSVIENPDWIIGAPRNGTTMSDQSMVVMSMAGSVQTQTPGTTPALARLTRSSNLLPTMGGNGLGIFNGNPTRAFSTLATDAEGQPWLIIGAGDRIWAEDARLLGGDAGTLPMNIKAVPLPSADIQALAFTAFDRGDAGTGPLLDGYTIEQQRLFRVIVHSPQLWLADEIRITGNNSVPVSLWMQGGHGRVGTSDGRVFGLPVPVALSGPIPEAPLPTVLAYGSLCGQGFALSASALYRLSLETPPLGTWKRVPLEAAFPGLDGYSRHWARVLHQARVGAEEHLYLFSDSGLVIDVRATCP